MKLYQTKSLYLDSSDVNEANSDEAEAMMLEAEAKTEAMMLEVEPKADARPLEAEVEARTPKPRPGKINCQLANIIYRIRKNLIIVKLDFRDAFNTLRRDALLETVAADLPELYKFVHDSCTGSPILQCNSHTIKI